MVAGSDAVLAGREVRWKWEHLLAGRAWSVPEPALPQAAMAAGCDALRRSGWSASRLACWSHRLTAHQYGTSRALGIVRRGGP